MHIDEGSIDYGINAFGNIQGGWGIFWIEEDVKVTSLVERGLRGTHAQICNSLSGGWRDDR
jgi:hypothetical protein